MKHIRHIVTLAIATWVMAAPASATGMPELARQNQCVACHAIDTKVFGPAWSDVAQRYKGVTRYTYKGVEYPLLEGLVQKVAKGGAGNWGAMPMPGNSPAVNEMDIRTLVQFILNLAG